MGPPTSTNNSPPAPFQLLPQDVTATTPETPDYPFATRQPALPGLGSGLQLLTAPTPWGSGLWKAKGVCTFKGLVRWESGVCWKQLPFGPFKFPNSAASDLDRPWPQRVAVVPSV